MKALHQLLSIPAWCRLTAFTLVMCQLDSAHSASFYWDSDASTVGNNVDGTGLGGTGAWDLTTSNWWNGAALGLWLNNSADTAVFSAPMTVLPTLRTVTLSSGITAGQLSFLRSGYTLTGGSLTLAGSSPTLRAALGESITINTQILGSGGLTMLGGGTIRLGNNASSYTGTTTISNGSLTITDEGALGDDLSAIVVTGFNPVLTSTNLRGFGGGSLVLDGTAAGITLTRDLLLQGQGPISDRGAALMSTGLNTLSGIVTMGAPYATTNLSTRIIAADGTLNFTGTLNVLGTAATTISSLGGTNQAGASFYNLTGVLAGSGTLEGSGGGTLFLNPTDSSGFSGTIRVSGSAASGQSVVRIDSAGVLGTRTAGTTSAVLDMNGGILAVLMDAPDVKVSNGSNANVYFRATSSIIFTDHTPNSLAKDQTVAFGSLTYEDGITLTFNSRNGYGMSFTTAPVNGGNGDTTMANNLQGGALLSFTGNFWSNTENTGARTMTISGNGNTLINGNIIGASASFAHNLVKSGSGTLTITGTGSTLDGTVSVSGGTLAVNDWRAINNNSGIINIGTSTTSATLSVIGNNVLQSSLTTSKVINLAGSTGGATILASQTGTSPGLILNADFSATGGTSANAKTLTLGGTNIAQNTINGIISNNDAGGLVNLTKVDAGTWVLAGANAFTGTTTITNGILKLKANAAVSTIIADSSAITFNQVNQYAGGTLEFVGQASASNVETLGVLTPTLGSGTIKLSPGSGGTASLVFASLGAVGGGSTVNIVAPSSSSTVSFASSSITSNIANAGLFYNGSDFAFVPGSGLAVRAPDYTTDADFATSATALTSGKSNEITGSFSNAAVTIDSLKINGAQVLNLTGLLTIRTAGTANASGGIIQTGGSGSISGTGVTTGGSGVLIINVDGGANTLTLNAPITSTATGGFTKVGAGTLVIAGLNAQTGVNSINEGTVQLATGGRLSAGGTTATLSIRQGAVFDLNGVNVSLGIDDFNNNGTVTNTNAAEVTLTIGNSNGGGTSFGIIDQTNGVINLIKLGTGAMSWSGLSTYTGVTTIGSTGIVTVNNVADGGFASGFGAASNAAGNLVFTGTSTTQAYGGLSFAGATNDSTDHLFTFNGGASGGARIQANGLNGATLSFTNTGALAFGAAATGNAQGLVLGGTSTGDNRFFPIINDNGAAVTSVYKADTGVWYLNAVNGYSGVTELRGGVLYAQSGTSLPTASNLVFNGGIFASTGTLSRTLGTGVGQMNFAAPAANTAMFRGGFAAGGSQLIIDWGGTPTWGVTPGFLDNRDGLIFGAAVGQTSVAKSDVEIVSGFSLGTASGAGSGPGLSYTLAQNSSTVTVASTAGLVVGQSITGTNIPSGVYIVSINSATSFTISANTANTSGIAGSYTDGQIYASSLRPIRVDDNTVIGSDFASLSGVISGASGTGIRKLGSGILILSGDNTYSGETNVNQGTLVVHSLGLSTGTGATSVGTEVNASLNSNAITLGNGGTGGAILEYVGLGETSDRKIRLNSTTGSTQIHADGVGALILTNVANDMMGGNKTLLLRGVNASGNMITSVLSDFGGTLGIQVDSSAMWILTNSSNNYTGTTTFAAGSLGIGDDHALGTSTLDWSNGTLLSYGADRTINNAVRLINNTTTAFAGDYSLTTTSVFQLLQSANNSGLNNNVVSGKALTFAGVTSDLMTANRAWTVDGSGTTIINGAFTTSTAFGVVLTKTGDGVLQLNGSGSNYNNNSAATDIDRGTLRMGVNNAIPSGAGFGGVVLSPELANGDTATFDLNGTFQTINGLTASTDGAAVIDNTSSTAASLTFGAADSAVSYGGGVGTYSIQNSGGGALSVTKTGTAAAVISTGVSLTYTGTTSVNGGTFTIGSSLNGTTGLSVTNGSTLTLSGGIAAPAAITSVVVASASTLNLLNGAGDRLNQLTILSLGSSGGTMTTLNLNVGDVSTLGDNASTDLLGLLAGGTLQLFTGNQIKLNLSDTGLNASQTYNLISSADGGLITGPLGAGDWLLGSTPGGFSSITIHQTDNLISITTGTLITGTSYWRGLTDATWNGSVNNWSQDKAGAIAALSTPGQGTDVIFQWDAPTSAVVSTTLEQSFKINSLTFEAATIGANTPASVTIASGTDSSYRLSIAPQFATDGIKITAGGPATVNITAPIRIVSDQTWSVADAGSVLSMGPLFGEADVIKNGAGRVTLTIAADLTFNSTVTSDFTISAGTLEILNATALGSTSNSNLATITVNTGGAFYYNGAANSAATGVANKLTLAGGTLSAGGNAGNNYYTGAVNVSAGSFINMRGSNSAVLTATQGNVVLSGVVSGAGSLTVDSISTLSGGNQLTGTLYFQSENSAWSGGINLIRGTLQTQTVTGLGTGSITASSGRIQFVTAGGTTYNLAQNITLDGPGGILELSADASGTPVSDMTVNLSGIITIGSATNANNALRITQASDNFSIFNITNSIILGNNASLSYQGSSVRPLIISAVISDGGLSRSLAINDELGAWAVTSQTIRLLGANTFGGDISLKEGTLEYNTVTNIGGAASSLGQGAAINITGTSSLRFMGDTSQSTNRTLSSTASFTLDASGTSGAIITYAGAISQAADNSLTLTGTGEGVISGGISQPTGTSVADLNVNSGIWTLRDNTVTIADDVIVTGASTVLNLNSTGVLLASNPAGTSSGLYARTGAVINLNAADVNGVGNSGGLDFILLGDLGGPQTAILNTNTFNITTLRLDVGQRDVGQVGQIDGTGSVTVTGGDINLYTGTVNASLASSGTTGLEKFGLGTVTLKGDNSGLASSGNTILYEGTLVLDYTASNTTKLRAASVLEMLGGSLVLTGSATSATSQTVASTNLDGSSSSDNSGASTITLNPGAGQEIVLNLGTVARGNTNRDGTIRFILPTGTQTATNGFITSTLNGTLGLLGTSAFATVDDGTGVWFATNATNLAGGNVVALISTVKNDLSTWAVGDHVTDDTTGFTGTLQGLNINSLRFNAAAGSDLIIAPAGVLSIASGGILVTSNVGGTPSIQGGTLASGVTELIITQDSAQTFTISSDIRGSHAVTKSGTGTLLLTGNNFYTDETEILQGTLQVSGGNAIGDNSIVSLGAYQDTTLQLLADETIGRLSGGQRAANSDNGTVAVGTHTLTINEVSSTTYAGFFTGTGGIIKQSTGNLNLTNLSTGFTGIFTVAGGTLQLSGSGQLNASIIRVSKDGALLLDNNGTTRSGTRILDTTTVTLDSADGTFSGQTIVRGLAIRTDQGATTSETIGSLNFASGANYLSGETTNGTGTGLSAITADDFIRLNNSTVNVRGRSLGLTTGSRNQFLIGTSANQTAFIATMVGGGGLAGSTNISIVPWAVGETTNGALAATNMGNSLLTYVSGAGFRPLDFATEYKTLALAGPTDNARESLSADLTGLGGKTINSLVLNNVATPALNVTGSGSGQTLGVTSGALLFTVTGAVTNTAYTTTLGGFDNGITVGSTNEYVISVINPNSSNSLTTGSTNFGSSIVTVASTTGLQAGMPVFGAGIPLGATVLSVTDATRFVMSLPSILTASSQTYQYATLESLTASITSPLTSTADITKSGRGTLILSGLNTAGGGTMKTTLNEGILEIASLSNIGGTTGSLVFAGGTLRLGTGFTDDISLRTILFLQGGATIDTRGNDLALARSVGSGVGGLTKTGLGNLTLNAAATYTGATTIAGGTLTLGADNATGVGGDLNIGAGTTLDISIHHITAGLVSLYGDSPVILGSGSITASVGFYFGNTGDISVNAVLAGAGGLLKTQTTTLTLSGLSTFTGPVEVQAGTLSFNTITSVGGGASSLGNAATAQDGVIHMGLGSAATTLIYTGSGSVSDRTIGMQGTTGAVTLDSSGSGALFLGGVHLETAGNKTLTLKGLSDPLLANTLGAINEYGLGVLTLVKSDTNTWVLNTANSYSGATSINDGILRFTVAQNLAGALNFGSANTITTAGTLDLSTASATFAGNLLVQTNTASETNQILIGAGKTLTIGGTVTLGGTAASSTTLFSASGAGTLNVINTTGTGLTFLVGNNGSTNITTADFSALTTLNASLNTTSGILQVSSSTGTNSTGFATLILAQNTTITASALTVGGGGAYNGNAGQINSLKLGTGTSVINASAINIGTGSRDLGSITFLNSAGTVTIRAADGVTAAAFNMGSGTSATAALLPLGNRNTFDVSGHTADLLFSTVAIGTQNARTGPMENLFAFDTGTLITGNLTMGSKTAAGNSTNVMNLGGGVVTIGSGTGTAATLGTNSNTGAVASTINVTGGTVTIGSGAGQALILGNSNTSTGTTTSALNVSGGTVTLATTGTTAVTMANANAGTATATISITSGALIVQGDILLGTGAGTRNATITLNGGTLDMTGRSIGASTNAITLSAQSGTLKNLAQLNGGGTFTKTTTGTLYMDGVNSYTGPTTITDGTLQFLRETALYNNTPASWTDASIVVSSAATAAFNVGGTGEFTASDVDILKTLGTSTGGFTNGSFIGLDTTNATGGSFTYGGSISDTNSGANSVGLKKLGANTLVLTQTSTYSGTTSVAAGTLQVGDGSTGALTGSGIVTVSTTATLSGSGSIAGTTVITSGAVLAPGVGATGTSNQTITFSAAGTAVNINDGGQIQLSLTSSSQVDSAFDLSGSALTYLNTHGGATGTAYTTIWNQSGNYDSIKLTNGTFTLGTTAGGTVKLLNNSAILGAGSIFKLLDWTTVGTADSLAGSGSFTLTDLDLTGVALDSGLSWDTSALTTYGVLVVVPEPSRILLLMLGLSSFALRRRRTVP